MPFSKIATTRPAVTKDIWDADADGWVEKHLTTTDGDTDTDTAFHRLDDSPDLIQILKTLGKIFPEGRDVIDLSTEPYLDTHFRVGTHCIFFRDVNHISDRPCLQAIWAPTGRGGGERDTCDVRTMDDLVGWASCVHAGITDVSIEMLLQLFYPEWLNTSALILKDIRTTIRALGISTEQLADQMASVVQHPWSHEHRTDNEYRFRMAITGDGYVEGILIKNLPNPLSSWHLNYTVKIPVSPDPDDTIEYSGGVNIPCTEGQTEANLIESVQKILDSIYFQRLMLALAWH